MIKEMWNDLKHWFHWELFPRLRSIRLQMLFLFRKKYIKVDGLHIPFVKSVFVVKRDGTHIDGGGGARFISQGFEPRFKIK